MRARSVELGAGYAELASAWRAAAGGRPEWLVNRASAALARLTEQGLPTKRVEEWKYTDIAFLAETALALPVAGAAACGVDEAALRRLAFWHADDLNVVFVNGRLVEELSPGLKAPELSWTRLDEMGASPEAEAAAGSPGELLNAAFAGDGLQLRVAAGTKVLPRIHVLWLHAGEEANVLMAPWLGIRAERESEARVAVTAYSLTELAGLHVPRVAAHAEAGAQLAVSQSQRLNVASWMVGTTRLEQEADSRVVHLEAALGGALSRHDVSAVLLESGGEVELNGLYALRGRRHTDFHTLIEHRKPNCNSRQEYKGILDGKSAGVFNGAVRVLPKASGTDGYQLNKALLMSRDAQMFSKPELLIDNDDVRCTHGATIGQLSEQELFYLQSRGIAEAEARHLLARGFVEDILFRQGDERQRADLDNALDQYFAVAHE